MTEAAYQSLYRRFRPQRFGEIRGQEHVVAALHGAVANDRVSHAYLFSGPRGTGKTSAARILAKALNCANPGAGEPCGTCPSCVAIASGTSLDVIELDAASHNGVDAMRELVARAGIASPGRWKVYIVDEVHMLSTAAANALLKTLEEPPPQVVFVLATTDPHKVLQTIRSRTQHLEFRLLGPATLLELARDVDRAAGLGLDEEVLREAVRLGRGSARDTLSALDQLLASGERGGAPDLGDVVLDAIARQDAGAALRAVAEAAATGVDGAQLLAATVESLRQAFLALLAPELVEVPDAEALAERARSMGPATVVRALETLGRALVELRDALEPRVVVEAALARLTEPGLDHSPAALLERLERLERLAEGGGASGARRAAPETPAPAPVPPPRPRLEEVALVADRARDSRTDVPTGRRGEPPTGHPAGAPVTRPPERPAGQSPETVADRPAGGSTGPRPAPPGDVAAPLGERGVPAPEPAGPSRDDLVTAWGDGLLASLPGPARARFRYGRFVACEGGVATFALPDAVLLSYCEPHRATVQEALGAHFGTPVRLELVVDEHQGALLGSAGGAGGAFAGGAAAGAGGGSGRGPGAGRAGARVGDGVGRAGGGRPANPARPSGPASLGTSPGRSGVAHGEAPPAGRARADPPSGAAGPQSAPPASPPGSRGAPEPDPGRRADGDDELEDLDELLDGGDPAVGSDRLGSVTERLLLAFPGAEEVTDDEQ